MKKRYIVYCLLFVFFLTGCNAKYSLEIKDGIIKETFSIIEKSDSDIVQTKDEFGYSFYDYAKKYGEEDDIDTNYENYYSLEECPNNCSFYEKKLLNDEGIIGFELSHEFTFDDYMSSTIAKELIPAFSAVYDGRYLKISSGPNWKYFESYNSLEKINFSIETNYKVTSTNIKEIGAGKYEWSIDDNDEKLYITLDTNTVITDSDINSENNDMISYLIIFLAILFVSLIVCVIINRKKYH